MRCLGLFFVVFSALFPVITPAQINTGKITGFVTDPSGAFIAGITVTATNDGTSVVTKAETSDGGEYLLNFLVPGTYHVEVGKEGFKKVLRSGVIVDAGGIDRIDFSLLVGDVSQTIDVQASST